MEHDAEWNLGEELRALDAHRTAVLTVDHLLAPPPFADDVVLVAPSRRLSYVRLASVAAVVAAGLLTWTEIGTGDDRVSVGTDTPDRPSGPSSSFTPRTTATPVSSAAAGSTSTSSPTAGSGSVGTNSAPSGVSSTTTNQSATPAGPSSTAGTSSTSATSSPSTPAVQPSIAPATSSLPSPTTTVASPPPVVGPPAVSWSFDSVGSSPVVSEVGGVALSFGDGVAATSGQAGTALGLNGFWPSAAATTHPVIDTTKSFTVTTVVNSGPLRDCLFQTFVSQDGAAVSGFGLGMHPACNDTAPGFTFVMNDADTDGAAQHRLTSTTTVTPGQWYHLVAVADFEAGEMRLYVDGRLEATGPTPATPWASSGPFAVGRARFSSQQRDFFAGSIDTTTLYHRALSDAEVAAL